MNGLESTMSTEDFKSLSADQKLDALWSAQITTQNMIRNFPNKYAGKWVETWTVRGVAIIILGFLGTVFAMIGWHQPPNS